ncbi:MAG: 4Fe-4S dicluster domain-containing protein [Nitrospina sp.]|jgi:Fe-S oxidoreductase|nr:4Fe-4S dicluster domain-containing protein [Nitrospina sp.]
MKNIEIKIVGKPISAQAGETIVHALWAAGMAESVQTGCAGGVCGACTVTVRYADGKPGGTELACMKPVEEGMEVFPCPVEPDKAVEPVANPDALTLQSVFPTVNRCTKCGSCTTACPMSIPVMDSVMRMQQGDFDAVAEDFTTCIHCGLCRFVCEDKVKPHNMGLWIRRSLGKSQPELKMVDEDSDQVEKEWQDLMTDDKQERMQRAKTFRETGSLSK